MSIRKGLQHEKRLPSGKPLRDVSKHPGIFCNGGLVLGPSGVELERHALGKLQMLAPAPVIDFVGSGDLGDFVTALLDWWDAPSRRSLTENVGVLFFLPHALAGYDRAYSHVDAFCNSQRVTPIRCSRAELLSHRMHTLQIVLLFPPLDASVDLGVYADSKQAYDAACRPWQLRVQKAMEDSGLTRCGGAGASGIKFTAMKDPWPEVDICNPTLNPWGPTLTLLYRMVAGGHLRGRRRQGLSAREIPQEYGAAWLPAGGTGRAG